MGGQALANAAPDPFLIVPGKQIGLVKLPAAEADFVKAYGREAQPAEVGEQEGGIERVTVLFPCDYKRIAVVFYDPQTRKVRELQAPADYMIVVACAFREHKDPFPDHRDPLLKGQLPGDEQGGMFYNGTEEANGRHPWWEKATELTTPKSDGDMISAWHLPNGVHAGMSVAELQKLNGRVFGLSVADGEIYDAFPDWHRGNLENCFWTIFIDPPKGHNNPRDTFTSSDAGAQASPVDCLDVSTSPDTGSPGCKTESPK